MYDDIIWIYSFSGTYLLPINYLQLSDTLSLVKLLGRGTKEAVVELLPTFPTAFGHARLTFTT